MTGEKREKEAAPGKGQRGSKGEKGTPGAVQGQGPAGATGEKGAGHQGPRKSPEEEMTGEQRIIALGACPFAHLLGMEIIEARPGWAKVVMDATGKENVLGVAHGGAIFALADQAFAAAANRGDVLQVAVSVHIHYLAPAKGRLEAVARLIGETDTYSHLLVEVKSGERLVATFEGVAYKA
jgi:acyl-CoA thioesterase